MLNEKKVFVVFGYKVLKENCPFGYDRIGGEIVVNPIEAEIVRYIFEKHIDLTKELKDIPQHWKDYLVQKDEEYAAHHR